MADSTPSRSTVFISYSHRDKDYLDRLHVFLKPWLQEKHIEVWDDTRLKPGDHWEEAIARALASARVAVLLVSPDFLASDFITQNELPPLLDAAEREGAVILPVILMPCLFRRTKLSQFQTVNDPTQPLSLMPPSERDVIWERLVEQMLDALAPAPAERAPSPAQPASNDAPEAPKEPAPVPKNEEPTEQRSPVLSSSNTETSLPQPGSVLPEKRDEARRIGTVLLTYKGHTDYVNAVTWSPDGLRIASGSSDKTVQVWNVATGEHIFTHKGHSKQVNTVAWSPNGRRIASGSGIKYPGRMERLLSAAVGEDRWIQVWDADFYGGRLLNRLSDHNVSTVAWSPDSARIVFDNRDGAVICDALAGTRILTCPSQGVRAVAWSPDDTRIAFNNYGNMQVWDVTAGKRLLAWEGHPSSVLAIGWSPDSARIVSAGYDFTAQVWDAATGKHLLTYNEHSSSVHAVAWSPDGTRIASGSLDTTVRVWNATTGEHLFTYQGHSNSVGGVAWSPDGTRIASGSADGTVQVWSAG